MSNSKNVHSISACSLPLEGMNEALKTIEHFVRKSDCSFLEKSSMLEVMKAKQTLLSTSASSPQHAKIARNRLAELHLLPLLCLQLTREFVRDLPEFLNQVTSSSATAGNNWLLSALKKSHCEFIVDDCICLELRSMKSEISCHSSFLRIIALMELISFSKFDAFSCVPARRLEEPIESLGIVVARRGEGVGVNSCAAILKNLRQFLALLILKLVVLTHPLCHSEVRTHANGTRLGKPEKHAAPCIFSNGPSGQSSCIHAGMLADMDAVDREIMQATGLMKKLFQMLEIMEEKESLDAAALLLFVTTAIAIDCRQALLDFVSVTLELNHLTDLWQPMDAVNQATEEGIHPVDTTRQATVGKRGKDCSFSLLPSTTMSNAPLVFVSDLPSTSTTLLPEENEKGIALSSAWCHRSQLYYVSSRCMESLKAALTFRPTPEHLLKKLKFLKQPRVPSPANDFENEESPAKLDERTSGGDWLSCFALLLGCDAFRRCPTIFTPGEVLALIVETMIQSASPLHPWMKRCLDWWSLCLVQPVLNGGFVDSNSQWQYPALGALHSERLRQLVKPLLFETTTDEDEKLAAALATYSALQRLALFADVRGVIPRLTVFPTDPYGLPATTAIKWLRRRQALPQSKAEMEFITSFQCLAARFQPHEYTCSMEEVISLPNLGVNSSNVMPIDTLKHQLIQFVTWRSSADPPELTFGLISFLSMSEMNEIVIHTLLPVALLSTISQDGDQQHWIRRERSDMLGCLLFRFYRAVRSYHPLPYQLDLLLINAMMRINWQGFHCYSWSAIDESLLDWKAVDLNRSGEHSARVISSVTQLVEEPFLLFHLSPILTMVPRKSMQLSPAQSLVAKKHENALPFLLSPFILRCVFEWTRMFLVESRLVTTEAKSAKARQASVLRHQLVASLLKSEDSGHVDDDAEIVSSRLFGSWKTAELMNLSDYFSLQEVICCNLALGLVQLVEQSGDKDIKVDVDGSNVLFPALLRKEAEAFLNWILEVNDDLPKLLMGYGLSDSSYALLTSLPDWGREIGRITTVGAISFRASPGVVVPILRLHYTLRTVWLQLHYRPNDEATRLLHTALPKFLFEFVLAVDSHYYRDDTAELERLLKCVCSGIATDYPNTFLSLMFYAAGMPRQKGTMNDKRIVNELRQIIYDLSGSGGNEGSYHLLLAQSSCDGTNCASGSKALEFYRRRNRESVEEDGDGAVVGNNGVEVSSAAVSGKRRRKRQAGGSHKPRKHVDSFIDDDSSEESLAEQDASFEEGNSSSEDDMQKYKSRKSKKPRRT